MNKQLHSRKGIKTRSSTSISSKPLRCLTQKDLIVYKLFYFFLYGALGSLLPYLPLYLKQLGIQVFEAGIIIGVRPLVQIIGAPLYGALADGYRAGKLLLLFGVLGWIVKALMVMAVRPHNQQCISFYRNVSENSTSTYIYALPLWAEYEDNQKQWTLIPLHTPLVIKQQRLTLLSDSFRNNGHSTGEKPSKHEDEQNVISKTKKRKLTKRKTFNSRAKADVRNPCSISRKNHTLRCGNSSLQFISSSRQEFEVNDIYAKHIIRRRLTNYLNATVITGQKKDTNQMRYSKEKLERIGKSITHSVRVFDLSLNTTVTYVTQVDIGEVQFMFVILVLVVILGEFLESPTFTLSDSSLLDRLGEDREYYGNIRMFGSLGWALTSVLVGYLVAATAFNLCEVPSGNYFVAFYIFIVCCSVVFFCVLGFTFKYDSKVKPSGPSCREVGQLLLNLRFSSFLVSVLFVGWCYGFLIHFVNWFIDDLNGSPVIMGVAGAARELTGLAFFFIGGSVISVLGHINTMVLCLLAYMALFYCYSVVINPWFVVGLEMMAGANYALAWSTCVNYTNRVGSALGVTATVQGLLQAVFWGFGNGGGSVLSSALYHYYGPVKAFKIFAVASGITVLHLIITCKISEKLKVPDLTNMEALYDMTAEIVKPSRDADNLSSLETLEDESLEYCCFQNGRKSN